MPNQSGNTNWNAAPQVSQSFNVDLTTQTITFPALADASFGGAAPVPAATATSGLAVSYSSTTPATCSVAGSVISLLAVGDCTIEANQAGNGTYSAAAPVQRTFAINKGSQVITFGSLADKILADSPVTVGATASSGLAVSFSSSTPAVCTVAGTSVTLLSTGLCTIDANQSGNTNWNAAPQVSQSFNVNDSSGLVWYFAEGYTGAGWTTELRLLNANLTDANVSVTYLLDTGTTVTKAVVVSSQSELTLDASNVATGPGVDFAFGVRITSDLPIVAEEQMYAGSSGDYAHGTTGSRILSNTWYFAEGYTQFGWQTFVLVANPGASAADVTITYEKQAGGTVTDTVTVGAGQRYTFVGHVDVPNEAFSVTVSSTQPIVSEMSMYDPGRSIAHRTVGVPAPATTWYLGEGFTGAGWQTFISIGNPGAADATVTATFNIDGEAPVVRNLLIPAHSRGTFIAHELATGVGVDKAFGVFIVSNAPVVVQEVLIDPADGASRSNSTMAASSLASEWSFSGGSSMPGNVTFITVSNPGIAEATVTATYYFNDGTAPVEQQLTLPAQSRGTFSSNDGIPTGKTFGIVVSSSGSPVVAQEAVYDEPLFRAFSAGGALTP